MERVDSAQMQLGSWVSLEASMLMFTVADAAAIATHLRSSALVCVAARRLLLSTLYR